MHAMDTVFLFSNTTLETNVSTTATEPAIHASPRNPIQSVPMQMCNVRLANFGLNERGKLMLIDTDKIHSDYFLFHTQRVCTDHESCHYYDCKSTCASRGDSSTKQCTQRRVNNNLQSLCANIFDINDGNDFGNDEASVQRNRLALLTGVDNLGSNVHAELTRRLKDCKNTPHVNNTQVPSAASETYFKVLDVLLSDETTTTDEWQ